MVTTSKAPNFNRAHVRKAAKLWQNEPRRGGFHSSIRYDVEIDGKLYPPKAIASLANELASGSVLTPKDFAGAKDGKWLNALRSLGFAIHPKASKMIDLSNSIHMYRDDERFLDCPRAFLVTGRPKNDQLNRQMLAKNQSGHWRFKNGRAEKGDAIFLLLPSENGKGGYPRELFCGVLDAPPDRSSKVGRTLFQVKRFHRLATIAADIKSFLVGHAPPQGDSVMSIWDDAKALETLSATPGGTGEDGDDDSYPEGAKKFKEHMETERNRKVVRLAKARRLEQTGKLECEACNFDFAKIYGESGTGFIEAHHRVPIASIAAPTHVRIEDFELVCSNCHSMLHRMKPLKTALELRKHLLKKAKLSGLVHSRSSKSRA